LIYVCIFRLISILLINKKVYIYIYICIYIYIHIHLHIHYATYTLSYNICFIEQWKIHRSLRVSNWIIFTIYGTSSENSYRMFEPVFDIDLLINNPRFISALFWGGRIRIVDDFKCETYKELYWQGGVRNANKITPETVHPSHGSLFCLRGFCLARVVTAIRYQPLVIVKASPP